MRVLNTKVAADGQGTFHFECPFLLLPILSTVFHMFLKKKFEIKIICLRMNPSTHSTSLKKIHLFLQSSVEGYFLFYFPSKFHFLDLFFSDGSCCERRLCYNIWTWLYMSYILRLRLGFSLIMMFVCHGRDGLFRF
jgi:hypothetical protein